VCRAKAAAAGRTGAGDGYDKGYLRRLLVGASGKQIELGDY